ncbi:RICIN domain-containing protein [Polymorphospora rubra]|uniref:RICIN domain-containing protein n=1 Tax=Polymorphospora rubra TaxID=338584 RepID=UPI0033E9E8A8
MTGPATDPHPCATCGTPSTRPTCDTCPAGDEPVLVRPYVDRPADRSGVPEPDDSMTMTWEFPAAAVPAVGPPPGTRDGGTDRRRPGGATKPAGTGTAGGGLAGRLARLRTRDRLVLIGTAIVVVVAAPIALARTGGSETPGTQPAADGAPGWAPATTTDGRTGDPSTLPDPARSASPRTTSAPPASRSERSASPGPSATPGGASPTAVVPTGPATPFAAPRSGRITGTSGLCVDNMHDNTNHGNPITMAPCNGTDAQHWSFREDGTLQMHHMCMGPAGNGASSPVQLRRCGRGNRPTWQFRTDGSIVHLESRLCLHDRSGAGGPVAPNGAPQLTITRCTGATGQRWSFR